MDIKGRVGGAGNTSTGEVGREIINGEIPASCGSMITLNHTNKQMITAAMQPHLHPKTAVFPCHVLLSTDCCSYDSSLHTSFLSLYMLWNVNPASFASQHPSSQHLNNNLLHSASRRCRCFACEACHGRTHPGPFPEDRGRS